MDPTVALIGGVALLAAVVTFINNRHDAKKAALGPKPDERVDEVWGDHGANDDPGELRSRVDALLDKVDPSELRSKSAVIELAVMATRAERFDVLPALADAARDLDGGCGETAALAVLAEACTGDLDRARAMYVASQSQIAGCSSCGSAGPGRYLMQEVAVMLDAMESRAAL